MQSRRSSTISSWLSLIPDTPSIWARRGTGFSIARQKKSERWFPWTRPVAVVKPSTIASRQVQPATRGPENPILPSHTHIVQLEQMIGVVCKLSERIRGGRRGRPLADPEANGPAIEPKVMTWLDRKLASKEAKHAAAAVWFDTLLIS